MSRQFSNSQQHHGGDDEDFNAFELDSLLESMGPCASEISNGGNPDDDFNSDIGVYQRNPEHQDFDNNNNNDDDDDDDDDEDANSRGHMVDIIDPDAVDFTPFLKNHAGTAINYHDESHMITEHHEKLHRKTLDRNESPFSKQSLSHGSSTSNPSKHATAKISSPWACLQSTYIQCATTLRLQFQWKSNSTDEKPDRVKYLILFMLIFILFVFLRHSLPPPLQGKEISKTDDIADNRILPHDFNQAYRNVDDLPLGMMDTPIYWHIPRSGGTTMKLIMSMCMGRVVACEQGAGHQLDEQLELINKPFGNFANVDTSTPLGLQRAADLGLIPSRIVDVVLTPHVREAAKLFDAHHKGRLFALFRNPVDRIVSLYYFLRMPDQEEIIGLNVRDMSLEQFASDISENWMIRSLTNTMSGPLTADHLLMAKEMLRTKFLIGLLNDKTESLRRIEAYFGWKLPSRVSQTCKNNMFYFEPQSKNIHEVLDPATKQYADLAERNQYDMELYDYAVQLFEEQGALIAKVHS